MFITKSFLHVLKVRNPVSPRERPEMEYTVKVDPNFREISQICNGKTSLLLERHFNCSRFGFKGILSGKIC